MKKIALKIGMIVVLASSVYLGVLVADAYTTKTAKGFYRSDFTPGIATQGLSIISSAGIGYTTYSAQTDPTQGFFISNMESREVVLVHCHGAPGLLAISPSVTVYGNNIPLWTVNISSRLVYLSACATGNTTSIYGDFPMQLVTKGVGTVISFKDNISASTGTNGIHRFNSLVMTNLTNGYSVGQAVGVAWTTFRGECSVGAYYGADQFRITGNGSYVLKHQ